MRDSTPVFISVFVPWPCVGPASSGVGDAGVGIVFGFGERGSCGCREGVVGRGISAGFVGRRMGLGGGGVEGEVEGGFGTEFVRVRIGRRGRGLGLGIGIVSVIQLSGAGLFVGLCGVCRAGGALGLFAGGGPRLSAAAGGG